MAHATALHGKSALQVFSCKAEFTLWEYFHETENFLRFAYAVRGSLVQSRVAFLATGLVTASLSTSSSDTVAAMVSLPLKADGVLYSLLCIAILVLGASILKVFKGVASVKRQSPSAKQVAQKKNKQLHR